MNHSDFDVTWGDNSVTISLGDISMTIDDIRNPALTEGELSHILGMRFGHGGAAPIFALRSSCPDETMEEKYTREWGTQRGAQ